MILRFLPPSFVLVCSLLIPRTSSAALVAWWKFDEGSGSTTTDTIANQTATLASGATWSSTTIHAGTCINFDGTTNGYLELGSGKNWLQNKPGATLMAWIRSDVTTSTNRAIIWLGSGTANQARFALYHGNQTGNTNTLRAGGRKLDSNTFQQIFAPSNLIAANTVYHVAATADYATNEVKIYLNGNQVAVGFLPGWGTTQNTTSDTPGAMNRIGAFGTETFDGLIDDVRVYDTALSQAEINAIRLGDNDGDLLPDSWEMTHFGNLNQTGTGDPDGDGLTNLTEFTVSTNPNLADTDADGLNDGAEINTHRTNPLVADTDGDGLSDGAEVNIHLTNPLKADSDGDSLTDGAEVNTHGTNPNLVDSDGDSWEDNVEIAALTNPLVATSFPLAPALSVHLNEFVAENLPRPNDPTAPIDIDGEYPDWIEIRNTGASAANLQYYQLTDDAANLAKYRFPSTSIPAGGYLVVYASGKNRRVNNVQVHTNFKLGSRGVLILSRRTATGDEIVSQIGSAGAEYPSQRQTVSYGRADNTPSGALAFMTIPTPGAANNAGSVVSEWCKDTTFSVDRGIYDAPFSVQITCATPGATIAWTVNGSAPSPTNGTQVPAANPLATPVATVNITGTTLLRARAWKTGLGSSDVDTQTYLFPAAVFTQNGPTPSMNLAPGDSLAWGSTRSTVADISAFTVGSPAVPLTFWGVNDKIATDPDVNNRFRLSDLLTIPSLSLVADWKHLFGPNSSGATDGGIYPPATGVADEGVDRVASLELINPNGSAATPNAARGFQADGNIHIFGGTSQDRWKSYKLSFRFQCTKEVNYRVYGDAGFNSFKNFILDATMNNTWMHPTDANQRNRGAFVRDFVMADLQNNMGQRGFHSRPCHLYLNGMYWGIYWLHEKPDHHFQAAYYGGDSDDYDVFKHSTHPNFTESDPHVNTWPQNPALGIARPTSANPAGNSTCVSNFEALLDLLGTGNVGANPAVLPDLSSPANYNAVAAMLDLDAFIDYMMLNFVAGNQDWADKNLYAARNRKGGKWRFFSWDAEHTFRTSTENFIATRGNEATPSPANGFTWRNGNPKQIHARLLSNPEYRLRFADRIRKHMFNDGALTVARMTAAFNFRLDEIDGPIRAESARWGHIRASLNSGVPFKRSHWLTEKNRLTVLDGAASLIQNRWNLYMAPGTGQFRQIGNGPLYPSLEAPNFSQHGGDVPVNFSLTLTNPNALGTIYYTQDGSDPRLPGGAINTASATAGTGIILTQSRTIKARVRNGTEWSALTEAYFSVGTVVANASNLVISEFSYRPGAPSLAERAAGFTDRNDFEFIELQNIGTAPVSLQNVAFNAGITFHFNNGTILEIPPGGRVLVVENAAAFAFRYGPGLPVAGEFELSTGLSNGGETVTLVRQDPTTVTTLKSFTYDDSPPWPGGTDGQGYSLVLQNPTQNPDHDNPANWRASTAIHGNPGAGDVIGFAAWMTANGQTAPLADPDHDGASNLIEYILAGNPNNPATIFLEGSFTDLTVGGVTESYLSITLTRRAGTEDVASVVQTSSDLTNWSPAVRMTSVPVGNGNLMETWRAATAISNSQRGYIRVQATQP